jgi:gamma-glutamyltranspeptidase / glutathione hydrolase
MRPLHTLLILVLSLLPACASTDPYARGCVAADHEIASRAGAEVLAKGGNAVDAAVATSFTLSVVRPYSCGIGGGGFMVIYFSDDGLARQRTLGRNPPRSTAINYREMAPAAITPDYYERLADPEASTRGGKAVAIPGTVAGLMYALENYGTLDRHTVLAPAIRAAEQGFHADAHCIAAARELTRKFEENPDWKERFAFVWRRFLHEGAVQPGDRIHIPEQARALRLIADHGAAGFQAGEVGKSVIAAIARDGGEITFADLVTFRVAESPPLSHSVFGHTVITMPPPSSGGVAMLETLSVFERILPEPPRYDEPPQPSKSLGGALGQAIGYTIRCGLQIEAYRCGADYLHPYIEASKNAFADRARYLADPDFVNVPVTALLNGCFAFTDRYNPGHTLPQDHYGTDVHSAAGLPQDGGTSHFSVVDRDGSAVACTETINLEFGSLLAVPEFGFLLNNQMDDFTTRRGQANAFGLTQSDLNLPEPGKRPLSSMTPTIVCDAQDRVQIVAGASGGPRIISAVSQCVLGAMLNPILGTADILAARRVHHQWAPDTVYIESDPPDGGFVVHDMNARRTAEEGERNARPTPELARALESAENLEADLRARGHQVNYRKTIGEVQMIRRTPQGTWDPACDPRKGGKPAGVPDR